MMIGVPYFLISFLLLGYVFSVLAIVLSLYGTKQSWSGIKFGISGMKQLLCGFLLLIVSQIFSFAAISIINPFAVPKDTIAALKFYTTLALPLITFGLSMIFLSWGLLNMTEDFENIEHIYDRVTTERLKRKKDSPDKTFKER